MERTVCFCCFERAPGCPRRSARPPRCRGYLLARSAASLSQALAQGRHQFSRYAPLVDERRLVALVAVRRCHPTPGARCVRSRPAGPAAVRLPSAHRRRNRLLRRVARAHLGLVRSRRARRRSCFSAAGAVAVWRLGGAGSRSRSACLAVSLAASALVLESQASGAAVVGWPLLWSIPLFPFRVVGLLDDEVAFAVGLAALARRRTRSRSSQPPSSACRATGSRPSVSSRPPSSRSGRSSRLLLGASAWENGQWNVDVGLAPLHRAAVDRARRGRDRAPARTDARPGPARGRGSLLGFATAVRPSNLFFAAARGAAGAAARATPDASGGGRRARVRAARSRLLAKGVSRRSRTSPASRSTRPTALGRLAALRPDGRCSCSLPLVAARAASPCPRWTAALLGAVDRDQRRPLHVLRAHAPASALPLRRAAGALVLRGGGSLVSDS